MLYRMILRNNCKQRVSDKVIRNIIKFARPKGVSNYIITIQFEHNDKTRNAKNCYGYMYPRTSPNKCEVFINIPARFRPHGYRYSKKSPGYVVNTLTEYILIVIAHELRHIWQWNNGKINRGKLYYMGSNRRGMSEVDCESYAFEILKKYKKKKVSFSK